METKTYGSITITEVSSIIWLGELEQAPSSPQENSVYKNTKDGIVYICHNGVFEPMVHDGSDGIDGANGADGLSVFITYHDGSDEPSAPTSDGTTNGWHTNSTADAVWMSQKVSINATSGTWGTPIRIKGVDGTNGKDGSDGVGIESQTEQYYQSAQQKKPSSADSDWETGWSDTFLNSWNVETKNLWKRQKTVWTNGEVTYVGLMLMDEYDIASVLARNAGTSVGEWCISNNKTIINGATIMTGTIGAEQVKADWVEAKHLKSKYLSSLSADLGEITAGSLKSTDYIDKTGIYSEKGTKIDLTNNYIKSKNFAIDESGNAYINGTIHAIAGEIGDCTIVDGKFTADKLSSISADLGEITAGSLKTKGYNDIVHWDIEGSSGLEYTLNDDGASYTVTGIGACTDTDLIIPSKHEGLPVTAIGDSSLSGDPTLTSVTIGYGVTVIEDGAFTDCDNLISVVIPDSVVSIGYQAFSYCAKLSSIKIPNSVVSLDDEVFTCCPNLTSVIIGNGVEAIGIEAFYNCHSLTNVIIGNCVTSIGASAFEDCSSLTSITLPASVTYIGAVAFLGTSLTTVYYKGSASQWDAIEKDDPNSELQGANIFYYSEIAPSDSGNYWHYNNNDGFRISCDDNMIDSKYFKVSSDGKITATSAELSGTITSAYYTPSGIVEGAINGASKGLSFSYKSAYGCYEVSIGNCTDSHIVIPSTYYTTANGEHPVCRIAAHGFSPGLNFYGKEDTIPLQYRFETIVIPDTITYIGEYAFTYCINLRSVEIPDSVTDVARNAFSECENLSKVSIGDGLTSISICMFSNCINLTDVRIGDNVEFINGNAFGNTGLQHIDLGEKVTWIDGWAFADCHSLKSIVIPKGVTEIGSSTFYSSTNLATIYYRGTKNEWDDMTITDDIVKSNNVTKFYYNDDSQTNYWSYRDTNGFQISCDGDLIDSKLFKVTELGEIIAKKITVPGKLAVNDININNRIWLHDYLSIYHDNEAHDGHPTLTVDTNYGVLNGNWTIGDWEGSNINLIGYVYVNGVEVQKKIYLHSINITDEDGDVYMCNLYSTESSLDTVAKLAKYLSDRYFDSKDESIALTAKKSSSYNYFLYATSSTTLSVFSTNGDKKYAVTAISDHSRSI